MNWLDDLAELERELEAEDGEEELASDEAHADLYELILEEAA